VVTITFITLYYLEELYPYIRALHVLAAALWLGESIIVNFVIYPALRRNPKEIKRLHILAIYRRLFNMTTMSVIITLLTGAVLLVYYTKGNLLLLQESSLGRTLIITSFIGFLLLILHVFEKKSIIKLKKKHRTKELDTEKFLIGLKWISRVTVLGLTIAFLIMLNAVNPML